MVKTNSRAPAALQGSQTLPRHTRLLWVPHPWEFPGPFPLPGGGPTPSHASRSACGGLPSPSGSCPNKVPCVLSPPCGGVFFWSSPQILEPTSGPSRKLGDDQGIGMGSTQAAGQLIGTLTWIASRGWYSACERSQFSSAQCCSVLQPCLFQTPRPRDFWTFC